jgi:hypothetical protein
MVEIRRLEAEGVRFMRMDKGSLGYADPGNVMTRERYKSFSGLHDAILAQLERDRMAQRTKRLEQEAAAAKAEADRRAEADASKEAERARHTRELTAIADAVGSGAPLPETATSPLLTRLLSGVTGLKRERDAAADRARKAETRSHRMSNLLRRITSMITDTMPKAGAIVRDMIKRALPPDESEQILQDLDVPAPSPTPGRKADAPSDSGGRARPSGDAAPPRSATGVKRPGPKRSRGDNGDDTR